MRVCFYVKDFPDPIVKEFDTLTYNRVTNEVRFYNYGVNGSVYVAFESIDKETLNLNSWSKNYPSLDYYALKRIVLDTGYIDLTAKIIIITDSKGERRFVNDAKIDSRSITVKFTEEH